MRSESEIQDMHNEAVVRADQTSKYPGMTYEQGVADALEWVTNRDADNPLED